MHLPTGIKVDMEDQRGQNQNKKLAMKVLEERVKEFYTNVQLSNLNNDRRSQIGCGARADKLVKTYRFRDNLVIEHKNGNKYSLSKFLKGFIE